MHRYADEKKALPPQALCNPNGEPLLSWRVLLLPYLEQRALFEQFKLDEPWDSPHNIRLLAQMPSVYAPFDGSPTPEPYTTCYQVFVGNGAAFEQRYGLSFKDDFPDGTSNTVLIVQGAEAVPWTKPADLDYAPDRPPPKLSGVFAGTYQVAFADGSARPISQKIRLTTLRALITRNGGETIDWHAVDDPR
jgi:Protein of unknown function (DUF1559)